MTQSTRAPGTMVVSGNFGLEVPNIAALPTTPANWIFYKGLHRPPPPAIILNPRWPVGAFTTAASFPVGHYFTTAYGTGSAYEPPKDLPIEQREMPVVGYRAWKFTRAFKLGIGHRVSLSSTGVQGRWDKYKNTAQCTNAMGHRAPDQHCSCGFYVLRDLDEVEGHVGQMNDNLVIGAVMGWGRVIQHGTEGWRAEFATVIGLLDCKFSKQQTRNTQDAARDYDVGVYERSQLEAHVHEQGDPLTS